jgi:hypothetical protein
MWKQILIREITYVLEELIDCRLYLKRGGGTPNLLTPQ